MTLGALGTSVSILVARAYGADRRGDLDHTVTAAVLTALVLGAVVSFVPWFFSDRILSLVGASPAVAAAGTDYFRRSGGWKLVGVQHGRRNYHESHPNVLCFSVPLW